VSAEPLPLVFHRGERAVSHAVDPELPAAGVARALALYFTPDRLPAACALVWRAGDGPRTLDPRAPLGEQVPADAEIDLLDAL